MSAAFAHVWAGLTTPPMIGVYVGLAALRLLRKLRVGAFLLRLVRRG